MSADPETPFPSPSGSGVYLPPIHPGRTPAPLLRASDQDRLATVAVLQDAMARGLLTPTEGGDRMGAAFAAVHRVDLEPLTADLPPAGTPPHPPGWRELVLQLLEQLRFSSRALAAGDRLRPVHALAVVLICLGLLIAGVSALHLLLDAGGPEHSGPGPFGHP